MLCGLHYWWYFSHAVFQSNLLEGERETVDLEEEEEEEEDMVDEVDLEEEEGVL